MKYDQIKNLPEDQFRRLTGVKRKMIEILQEVDQRKKARGARKNKLSIENQLTVESDFF